MPFTSPVVLVAVAWCACEQDAGRPLAERPPTSDGNARNKDSLLFGQIGQSSSHQYRFGAVNFGWTLANVDKEWVPGVCNADTDSGGGGQSASLELGERGWRTYMIP